MNWIKRPLLIYLGLGLLVAWGLGSFRSMHFSLFPAASELVVTVNVPYQSFSAKQFAETIGREIEQSLLAFPEAPATADYLSSEYPPENAVYRIKLGWGSDVEKILPALEARVGGVLSKFEPGFRDGMQISPAKNEQGFLAISFYSDRRDAEELHRVLSPVINGISALVPDAGELTLVNPDQKAIRIELSPQKLAHYQINPSQVSAAIRDATQSYNGGSIRLGGSNAEISLQSDLISVDAFAKIKVGANERSPIYLKDVGGVFYGKAEEAPLKFKTGTQESLVLFATPRNGGNIRAMADGVIAHLENAKRSLPADIRFQVLVNPSEFIGDSIGGVIKEVILASLLAVGVLFLFIGGARNVLTAAVEIPASLVISFVAMKMAGMSINLISLSGLALSAGMNVDASVVVLENIFRHFREGRPRTSEEVFDRVVVAVREVRLPILTSTLTSLLVFAPLVFTQGIANSLLGDLAQAVIFSHAISAIVALVLVPTIRFHLLKSGDLAEPRSPIEDWLRLVEAGYRMNLARLIGSKRAPARMAWGIGLAFVLLAFATMGFLRREIIGKPESDWLVAAVEATEDDPIALEEKLRDTEEKIRAKFPGEVKQTFTQQAGGARGFVMARLGSANLVTSSLQEAQMDFNGGGNWKVTLDSWAPSEFSLPASGDFKIALSGGEKKLREWIARDIESSWMENKLFTSTGRLPDASGKRGLEGTILTASPNEISRADLAQILRIATQGIQLPPFHLNAVQTPVAIRFPGFFSSSPDNLLSLPVSADGRVIPLGSLLRLAPTDQRDFYYRVNGQEKSEVIGFAARGNDQERNLAARKIADEIISRFKAKYPERLTTLRAFFPDPEAEVSDAVNQVLRAFLWSILLILLVLYFQFGSWRSALIGLAPIPFGALGAMLALNVFQSPLSLNACLGAILLNGISVANSILLVEFLQSKAIDLRNPFEVARVASVRLRPILITSLTTILGMLPIAVGWGEGGNTLQPLGICVSGGMLISTLLTIFAVPCLVSRLALAPAMRRAA